MNNNLTESKQLSPALLRKRKMLLILPAMVLPFITLAFWALGGGSASSSQTSVNSAGLNLQLPNARLKDDPSENKLRFYEQADRDSITLGNKINNDPFLLFEKKTDTTFKHLTPDNIDADYDQSFGQKYRDPNEEKVYQKLKELHQQLNASPSKSEFHSREAIDDKHRSVVNHEDISKLDQLLQNANEKSAGNTDDPELAALTGMMDKILDIQHPERVSEKYKERAGEEERKIYAVRKRSAISDISLLDTNKIDEDTENKFYDLKNSVPQQDANAIEAVVHEEQNLVNGAVIKLRLMNYVSINNLIIPKGNFVFGVVSLNGERLEVEVNSIRLGQSLFPVKLQVYDMDGLPGIYIPGTITREVTKQSADNATQLLSISSMDPSIKTQAAGAGIDAVKSFLSKKTKLVRVTVKAGYKVLLK